MGTADHPVVGILATEPSGDLLGAKIARALAARRPDVQIVGMGGEQMSKAGVECFAGLEQISVMGYWDVIKRLPEILRLRRRLLEALSAVHPKVLVGVDAPDFNLGIERLFRANGTKVIHCVSPTIWMWRRSRLKKIQRSVDSMLCLFPFELESYQHTGIDARFIGHPAADDIPMEPDVVSARASIGVPADARVVALLPGSRMPEIEAHTQLFLQVAELMYADHPDLLFIMPAADAAGMRRMEKIASDHSNLPLKLVKDRSIDAMAAADAVLVKSGTSTLQATLLKKPMVICYRLSPLAYAMLRMRKRYLPYVGLPNILSGAFVVPEFIQGAATAPKLATAMNLQLSDHQASARLFKQFSSIHHNLRRDAAVGAAAVIEEALA